MKTYKIYEETMNKKAVDNPSVRRGDPAAWNCLTDEQRDVICEWYYKGRIEREKQEIQQETFNTYAALFALTPFAFAYALTRFPLGWRMLLESTCALIIYWIVFYIFEFGYKSFLKSEYVPGFGEKPSKINLWFKNIVALLISFLATYTFLSQATKVDSTTKNNNINLRISLTSYRIPSI